MSGFFNPKLNGILLSTPQKVKQEFLLLDKPTLRQGRC